MEYSIEQRSRKALPKTVEAVVDEHGRIRLLEPLELHVAADVDVRGILLVDRTVPVGFQSMHCHVDVQVVKGTDPKLMKELLAATGHSFVVL